MGGGPKLPPHRTRDSECLRSPKMYMLGDIHIQTLSQEGQTSSHGIKGQTLGSLGQHPKGGYNFFEEFIFFYISLIYKDIVDHKK